MTQELINKIVKATGVQKNELVLVHFWGEDEDIALMHMFSKAVAIHGASPLELQQSRTVNYTKFAAVEHEFYAEKYFALFDAIDAVIDVFCYRPVQLDQKLDPDPMAFYRNYMAQIFKRLVQTERFSQIRLPTKQNAEESNLSPSDFEARMIAAYDIDYTQMHKSAQDYVSRLQDKCELTISTPNGHEVHFALSGRQWHMDAGEGDMPCGEVYIAPVEARTHGEVIFKKLYAQDVGIFDNIVLSIKEGVIVHSNDEKLNDYFNKLEKAEKTVCELGFGINPNVTSTCGYTVLDEKASGTFHIAIGANCMFGGENDASNHVDFVGTSFTILSRPE